MAKSPSTTSVTDPESYDNDLLLAMALLGGVSEYDQKGLPQRRYLEDESEEEREARQAIARVLRSDYALNDLRERQLRFLLACLFEPESIFPNESERRLIFELRRAGRPGRYFPRSVAIAQHVHDQIKEGKSADEAITSAANKSGRSRENVKDIWQSLQWAREAGQFD